MKQIVISFIILLGLFSCSSPEKNKNDLSSLKLNRNKIQSKDTIQINPRAKAINKNLYDTIIENKCNCNWEVEKLSYYLDLTFSNNGTNFSLDTLNEWKDNPKRLKIKSIRLIDFDTIPKEMGIFENVERISLRGINSQHITGLEVFPKLKILETDMLWEFDLSNAQKWLRGIEVIHSNKTKFIGLKSFNELPNLKELKISFSGFVPFPKDFSNLKCLNYFQSTAHRFGEIDLNKIDLTKMPCLKYVEFHSWWKNLKGIPRGIEKIEKVKIHHGNLTENEKEILNESSETQK